MPHTRTHARHYPHWRLLGTRLLAAPRIRCTLSVVVLVLALAAISTGVGASGSGAQASAHASAASAGRGARAGHMLIESADVHVDDLPSAPDFELDLSITQTRNDCEAPLRGQFCLRYGISLNDQPIQFGYGLIPASDVTVSGSSITLRTDTRHDPHVIRTAGAGGLIVVSWSASASLPRLALHATALSDVLMQGTVLGYAIPSTNVTAAVLRVGGA